MSPAVWQRVKKIVFNALEMKPEEWPLYLQKSCEGDPDVLREAQSLLEVSWSIGDFIEEPALELFFRRELTRN